MQANFDSTTSGVVSGFYDNQKLEVAYPPFRYKTVIDKMIALPYK